MFKFVGGPYDGHEISHEVVNQVALLRLPPPTESGTRLFVLMPDYRDYEKILAGELAAEDVVDQVHPYERFHTGTAAEFRYAGTNGRYEAAMSAGPEQLTKEAAARKRLFSQRADEFIERVNQGEFDPHGTVTLILIGVDREGNPVRSPVDFSQTCTVKVDGDRELAMKLAEGFAPKDLFGNINSIVRHFATGFTTFRDGPPFPFQATDFEMEFGPRQA
jgi:hypothetical protein